MLSYTYLKVIFSQILVGNALGEGSLIIISSSAGINLHVYCEDCMFFLDILVSDFEMMILCRCCSKVFQMNVMY